MRMEKQQNKGAKKKNAEQAREKETEVTDKEKNKENTTEGFSAESLRRRKRAAG